MARCIGCKEPLEEFESSVGITICKDCQDNFDKKELEDQLDELLKEDE